ncbi:MAG: hypothetical protein NTY20_03945 [Candidatus Aenigmarchaeota archaeon]|nr:hypothetical protein [Candidatus Aenigmarchaeota archaeon]
MGEIHRTERKFFDAVFRSQPGEYVDGVFAADFHQEYPVLIPFYGSQYAIEKNHPAWFIFYVREFNPDVLGPEYKGYVLDEFGTPLIIHGYGLIRPNTFAAKRPAERNCDEELMKFLSEIRKVYGSTIPEIEKDSGAFYFSPDGKIFARSCQDLRGVMSKAEMGSISIEGNTIISRNRGSSKDAASIPKYQVDPEC